MPPLSLPPDTNDLPHLFADCFANHQKADHASANRDFDGGVSTLLLSFWPALTCPKGHNGRVRAWNGFEKYYRAGGHEQGSALTQARYKIARQKGISVRDIARLEVTMIIGILTNTVPSGFWMIYFMYSQPTLLAELRRELDAIVEPASLYYDDDDDQEEKEKKKKKNEKGYTHARPQPPPHQRRLPPFFNNTWHETLLRSTTCGISSRMTTSPATSSSTHNTSPTKKKTKNKKRRRRQALPTTPHIPPPFPRDLWGWPRRQRLHPAPLP